MHHSKLSKMALHFFLRSSSAARHSFFRDLLTRRFDLRTMSFSSNIRNTLFCEKPPKGFEKFFRDKPSKKEVPKEEPKSSKEPPKQSNSIYQGFCGYFFQLFHFKFPNDL